MKVIPETRRVHYIIFLLFSIYEWQIYNRNILHYLDDFLFGGEANTLVCENTLQFFRNICKLWGEAEDKAVEPVEVLLF
jgi:hypothetical protein